MCQQFNLQLILVGGLGMISCHTNRASTACLSIVADHVHPFMATISSSNGFSSMIMHHVTGRKLCCLHEHDNKFSVIHRPPQSSDLNPIEHLWDVGDSQLELQLTDLQQLQHVIQSYPHGPESKRNVSNPMWNLWQIEAVPIAKESYPVVIFCSL